MATLHYAQSIFEGLKAYAQPDGSVATFRPEANAARFVRSAKRLAMPPVPEEGFLAAVDALVDADRDWVPTGPDQTLYIRPYQMASEPFLGVRPAHEYLFLVIASPAGAYFPRGVQPVSVYLSEDYIRAAPGGTGDVKCAGNYAASLLAQEQAIAAGCDQVVWLDAAEKRYVEEMGGMNLFFVLGSGDDAELVTPELTGTLLPGHHPRLADRRWPASWATRSPSAGSPSTSGGRAWPTARSPRPSPAAPPRSSPRSARSRRAPATSRSATAPRGRSTMRLRESLLDIQHGRVADTHGWLHRVA